MRCLRNGCLLLALIVSGSGLLYSQITITPQITPTPEQASTLTPDQQQQFDSQKLTVTGFGMTLASTRWVVTQGYNKLNEPDFLRILGLDKESLNSQSHQTGVAVLTWGGAGLGVVGLAVVLISTLSFATNPNIANGTSMPNIGAFTAKIGGGTLGIVGGTIMMGIGMTQSPNITPYGQAEAWAEKYNAQLVIKIAGKS